MRIKRNNADWHIVHELFIKTPEWSAMRAKVMQRANNLCECCLTNRAVSAHHVSYPAVITHETLATQPLWQIRAICRT